MIVAFIAVGILVGPSVLGWVSANDQVDLLAKLGIALLLFVVGLKLDLHIIRTMGPVAQISEFSLILGALGLSLGHIDADTMGLITLVGLITISASTYMILYSHPLYEKMSPWLGVFERKRAYREEARDVTREENRVDVILFGLGRFGSGIARELRQRGHRLLDVDFDPDLVRRQEGRDYTVRYGDAEDPEFLAALPLGQAHGS